MDIKRSSVYSAIVVMTYSSNLKSKRSPTTLSYYSRLTVNRACSLWKKQNTTKIIIPGETVFGSDKETTAQLMKKFLLSKNIPSQKIMTLSNLNNTAMQLAFIKKLQDKGLGKVLLVCMDFHSKRVMKIADQIGINADIEQVTTPKIMAGEKVKKLKEREKRLLTNPILKQLWFQNLWTKIFGVRIVDLNEDTYASFKKIKLFLNHKYN